MSSRNLKAVGLAVVAAFAMSAMVASTASAAKFTAANGLAQHLVATDVGAADKFEVAGSTLTCNGETFTSNAPAGQTTELSFTPNWINCKTEGAAFNNVTVTHNSCNLIFTSTPTPAVHIACGAKPIEVHHYSSSAHSSSTCTETIGTQTVTGHPTYTNVGNHVEVHGVAGVSLQTHGACSFGFTLNQTAEYTYSQTVTATSGNAIHVK